MDDTYGQARPQRRSCWAAVPPHSKQKLQKKNLRHRSNILYILPFSQNQPLKSLAA